MSKLRVICIVGCMVIGAISLLIPAESFAQVRNGGSIKGKVTDLRSKQPIEGVNIVLLNTKFGASTDENGKFSISGIPLGSYNLEFSHVSHFPKNLLSITVSSAYDVNLNVEMEEKVIQGEEIIVHPKYFVKPKYSSVSTKKVDVQEIRIDPGSMEDIQRVFQSLPSVVSGSDRENEIIVRAGMPGENLFVLDNIDIPNPNHFGIKGSSGLNVNMVNPLFVNDIQFYAGTFPAKYGDKVSSVLDINLRDGNRREHTGNFNAGLSGASGMIEGPLGSGKATYMFSARKSYYDIIIGSTRLKAVPEFYDLQGKFTWFISDKHKLTANGIFGDDNITSEGEQTWYTRGADNVKTSGNQYIAGATLTSMWGKNAFTKTTVSRVTDKWDHNAYTTADYTYYSDNTQTSENTIKLDFEYHPSRSFDLSTGIHYKNIEFDQNKRARADTTYSYSVNPPYQLLGIYETYDELLVNKSFDTSKLVFYAQFNINLVDSFDFHFGIRQNSFAYTGQSKTSVRVGLSTTVTKKVFINWGMGLHYQSPDLADLVSHPLNKDLKYKRISANVIGVEYLIREDLKTTAEYYLKDYNDVAIPESWVTPQTWDKDDGRRVSKGQGYVQGIELNVEKKFVKDWHLNLSLSIFKARAHDRRHDQYYAWDYDFRQAVTFIGAYKRKCMFDKWYQNLSKKKYFKLLIPILPFGDETVYSLRVRYLGKRPYTLPTYYPEHKEWAIDDLQLLNQHRLPAYFRIDLRLDKRYFFNNWNILSFINIINVTNRKNIWEYSYHSDGTKEEIQQFGLMPVVGISFEF